MNAAFVLVTAAWLTGADAAPAAPPALAPAAPPALAAPAAPPAIMAPGAPVPAEIMPAPAMPAAPLSSAPIGHAPGASCGSGCCDTECECVPEKKGFCARLKEMFHGGAKDDCKPPKEEPCKEKKGGLFHKKKKQEEHCDDCGVVHSHDVLVPDAAPGIAPHAAPGIAPHGAPGIMPHAAPAPATITTPGGVLAPSTIMSPGLPLPPAEKIGTPKEEGKPMPPKTTQVPTDSELAPISSKVIETETRHPFDLSRQYEARVERAADYSRITGQLFFVHADGGLWVLRYAPIGQEDPNGGAVILARDRQMTSYREGDLVQVKGEILNEKGSLYLGGPLYRAQSIQLLDRQD